MVWEFVHCTNGLPFQRVRNRQVGKKAKIGNLTVKNAERNNFPALVVSYVIQIKSV